MQYIWGLFLFPILIIFAISFIIGCIGFFIDIIKWSKRPERFEDISKDIGTKDDVKTETIDDILGGAKDE